MPGGDKTGPWGAGPMTGRGAGFCAGYGVPGYMNPAFGRGFGGGRGRGFGMGGGRGWRHQYYAAGFPAWGGGYAYPAGFPTDPGVAMRSGAMGDRELAYLKEQAEYFREALDDVESRVKELQQESGNAAKAQKKE